MENKTEKHLRIVKKSRVGTTVILYLFFMTCIVGGMVAMLYLTGDLLVDARLSSEYERIAHLAKIYEQGKESGSSSEEVLKFADRDFAVLDEQGNVILKRGADTFSEESGFITLSQDWGKTELCLDKNSDWIVLGENESYAVRWGKVLKTVRNDWIQYLNENYDDVSEEATVQVEDKDPADVRWEDEEIGSITLKELDEERTLFPVWFSVHLADGETFLGKAVYSINVSQAVIIIVCIVAAVLIVFLIFIMMIRNLVRNARRQRKVLDTFLTDPVTKGRNWTWFSLKQEPLLRGRRYAEKSFALIEIVFMNYRNFCTCHSLKEGEEILCKVYDVLSKGLTKREACAHVSTSSFAALMEYKEEQGLRNRLRGLIEALENIDPSHKFTFHIGVNLIEIQRGENNNALRRKNLNLEEEYNNACTARATLSDSDDSRIAFFDQQMVNERKWVDSVCERQENAIKNEEFLVYYQPKYDPKTKKLRGAEALIRWDSPELGFISPGKFIPIFEKNGFITEIDHYMLRHVAKDQKTWLDQGLNCVPVSVNVSRAHFIESDLAEQIRATVDQAGTPHNLIEIELTESAFFDDKNAMIKTIEKLKEYGFMVSMDDFGAGYSSLNSLKDMPLDVLKLDAEFFRGEAEGGRGEIVVAEAIKLAKNLNMHTVAEGVEEKAQVEFLAKQGCDMIQGYIFSEPVSKDNYVEQLKAGIAKKAVEGEFPVIEESQEVAKEALSAEEVLEAKEALSVEEVLGAKEALSAEEVLEAKEALPAEETLEAKEALPTEEALEAKEDVETGENPVSAEETEDSKEC